MKQGLRYNVVDQLKLAVQLHRSVFNPAYCEQVFDKAGQPDGVVIDVGIELPADRLVKLVSGTQEIAGVAGDGSQGRAQVVGDGAQQISTQLFVSAAEHFLLLFSLDPFLLKCHGALSEDGDDQLTVEGIILGQLVVLRGNPDDGIDPLMDTDRQKAHRICRKHFGAASGLRIVTAHPFHGREAIIIRRQLLGERPAGRKAKAGFRTFGEIIEVYGLIQELGKLAAGGGQNLIVSAGLMELTGGIKQKLRARVGGIRRYGDGLEPCGDGAGDEGNDQHDDEGHRIFRVIGVEREQRFRKEEVEHDHGHERDEDIADITADQHG